MAGGDGSAPGRAGRELGSTLVQLFNKVFGMKGAAPPPTWRPNLAATLREAATKLVQNREAGAAIVKHASAAAPSSEATLSRVDAALALVACCHR